MREANEIAADAIVMGSRGVSELKGLLVGSVSHKVMHSAPCTVITVT
nr:universal stress protein [Halomonas sp. BC04]